MFKRVIMVGLWLCLAPQMGMAATEAVDSIVAVVNNGVITQAQVQQRVNTIIRQAQANHAPIPPLKIVKQQVLDHLIDETLQLQYAKNLGLSIDDASVNKAIANIAAQNHLGVAQVQKAIQKQGISFSQYREEIRKQILLSQLQNREVSSNVKISEQEINDLMDILAKQPRPAAQYRLQDFLVPLVDNPTPEQMQAAKAQADKLMLALRQGTAITPQPLVADLGWRSVNQLPNAFSTIAQHMHPGDWSTTPILTGNGYHILRLLGVQNPSINFESSKTHARHILIKTNAVTNDAEVRIRLQELRQKIVHGEDFASLAMTHSQDPASAAKGGDLGWSKPGTYDPNFEKVMDQLAPGQISQAFATPFGWHIVQVLAREKSHDNKEFLREMAKQQIYRRKFDEAVHNWLLQLRSNAYLKITAET